MPSNPLTDHILEALPPGRWVTMGKVYAAVVEYISDDSAKSSGNYSPSMAHRQESWSAKRLMESGRQRVFSRAVGSLIDTKMIAVSGARGFESRQLCRMREALPTKEDADLGSVAHTSQVLMPSVAHLIRSAVTTPDEHDRVNWKAWRILNRSIRIMYNQLADANRRLHYLLTEQGIAATRAASLIGMSQHNMKGET